MSSNKNSYNYSLLSTDDVDNNDNSAEGTTVPKTDKSASEKSKWASIVLDKHDFNKNVLETKQAYSWQELLNSKPTWRSFVRAKQFMLLLLIATVMLYANFALSSSSGDGQLPVVHFSFVPGMREAKPSLSDSTQINNHVTTNESIPKAFTQQHAPILSESIVPTSTAESASNSSFASAVNIVNNISSSIDLMQTNLSITTPINNIQNNNVSTHNVTAEYLVWSERCKMPNIDPYMPEVMEYFTREKYEPCSKTPPLTEVLFNDTAHRYVLRVNEAAIGEYSKSGVFTCCYQSIDRTDSNRGMDFGVNLTDCISFNRVTTLAATIDSIIVRCRSKKKEMYVNGYALVNERPDVLERLSEWQTKTENKSQHRPPNVLMIGIDSISRLHLLRAMPKTAQYLYNNNWFPLSGFNKVDDNTFPNLMAVLTGYNKTTAFNKCQPTKTGGLDNCTFIWNLFHDHGYVTAYGEDEASINTFNYNKRGFDKPPTDYYIRPFFLSAEKHLHKELKSGLTYCLGYKHSAEHIYDYAIDFAKRYKDEPHFGLFWTNTFSHNALSDSSVMDDKMYDYLKRFTEQGILKNSIVIFFSDHGLRFGPVRRTLSGHYEERLPFVFVWLPDYLKRAHPEFVNALSVNKNRLTNFYDLHMTLKHFLDLTGRVTNKDILEQADSCAQCQTLLKPVAENRGCSDIAIEDHWCTCTHYESVSSNLKVVKKLGKYLVEYINNFLSNHTDKSFAKLCVKLDLDHIESAYRAVDSNISDDNSTTPSFHQYRIIFYTKPNDGIFESTVRHYDKDADTVEVTGEISRLNSYSSDSKCVGDGNAKKYCSCHK